MKYHFFELFLAVATLAGCQNPRGGDTARLVAAATPPIHAEGPPQLPLVYFPLAACKPYFSAEAYQSMGTVNEVTAARQRYPGSYMFTPADGLAHPGVLWLHGSEGGRFSLLSMCNARYLAANGYAALFFCYSDCGTSSLPEAVHDVDLKRTAAALSWLKESDYVSGHQVMLSGVSRGAEQAVLLTTLLARYGATDQSVTVPDALFAHAPFGSVVGGFNWRWGVEPHDFRWNVEMMAYRNCLIDAPNGPYAYQDQDGVSHTALWATDNPACASKPALAPAECWQADPAGIYVDPVTGTHTSWLSSLCGVAPPVDLAADGQDSVTAWTWGGSTTDLVIGSDIPLDQYLGSVLLTQGTQDEVWPFAGGLAQLMATLTAHQVPFSQNSVPQSATLPAPLPTTPTDRLVFETFTGEKHQYSLAATVEEWSMELSFLGQRLK